MTFAFYLKDKNKKEGTPLVLILSHQGRKYKKQVGITVRPADFKKQRTKDENINARLRVIEARLGERLDQFSTPEEIEAAISYALTGTEAKKENGVPSRSSRPRFWDYFKEWSERDTRSRKDRDLAYRRVSEIMGTREDWEEINVGWYVRFRHKCNDLSLSENYCSTLISKVKTVLIEGYKLGYHTSQEYRKFSYKWETADSIALTQDEVDALWGAELTGRDSMARDLFILGVYTASRYQNYSHLSTENIVNGMVQFVQPKTGDAVLLPLSPRVKQVLERNGGAAPRMTEQELGRRMKSICKGLGGSFMEAYDTRQTKGGKVTITKMAKWEKVSAHTARRTGATILHLAGVPDYQLMKLTGHRTIQNFQKYLRISKEDNARMLAKIPFFQ